MKNLIRVIGIILLAIICIIGIGLFWKIIHKDNEEGVTYQEVKTMLEAAFEKEIVFEHVSDEEISWKETLMILQREQKIENEESILSRGVQKMNQKYQDESKMHRDDWFGFYQILCTFLKDNMEKPVTIENVLFLKEVEKEKWTTNIRTLLNETDYPFMLYEHYDVVCKDGKILAVWKEDERELTMKNVLIESCQDDFLLLFYHDDEIEISNPVIWKEMQITDSDNTYKDIDEKIENKICDITFQKGKIKEIAIKQSVISGKVLKRTESSITIERENTEEFFLTPETQVYQLFARIRTLSIEDIPIGYEYADFVIENQQVAAVLLTREENMKSIRVLLKDVSDGDTFYETFCCTSKQPFQVIENQQNITMQARETYEVDAKDIPLESRIIIEPCSHTGRILCNSISRSQGNPAYRGKIEIQATENGLVIINEVLLEDYLYHVVPSEMPASYPMEALKTQAICARTYAYNKILHALYPQWGAHLDDTTTCQVYQNMAEHTETNEAVRETFGEIVTKEEIPIDTYYYSTSCGYGTTEEIWGNEKKLDYIQPESIRRGNTELETDVVPAVEMMDEDTFCEFIRMGDEQDYECEEPWYRWSYHSFICEEALTQRLRKCYLKSPDKIMVWQNEKDGYVSTQIPDLHHITAITVTKRLQGGVAHEIEILADGMKVKVETEQLIRTVLPEEGSKLMRWDGSEIVINGILPSAFFYLHTSINEENGMTELYLNGGGYGHGVGMSQNAAAHMAEDGMMAEEIIAFFYKDTELKKIY